MTSSTSMSSTKMSAADPAAMSAGGTTSTAATSVAPGEAVGTASTAAMSVAPGGVGVRGDEMSAVGTASTAATSVGPGGVGVRGDELSAVGTASTAATSTAVMNAAEGEGAPADAVGVRGGRARIDAIDAELIALVQRRMAVSAEIQAARIAEGGRRLDLRRETEVIGRYTRALGRPGTTVAMALLELGRGRV
jgi:chorismate mutase